MSTIDAKQNNLNDILHAKKYRIEYYQREYTWGEKETLELLDDLTSAFEKSYNPEHQGSAVLNYEQYFLGSAVLSTKEYSDVNGMETIGHFIVDGQQRLTTLTLLLAYLRKVNNYAKLDNYVSSENFGKKSFVIDVPSREKVMNYIVDSANTGNIEDIAKDNSFTEVSERNIVKNYRLIEKFFEETHAKRFDAHKLELFAYWMEDRVILVKISVGSDEAAYSIFEAMNTRGKDLTNAEMLKGFLISHTGNRKTEALHLWEKVYNKFATEDDFNFFMAMFVRGQFVRDFPFHNKLMLKPSGFLSAESLYYKLIKDREKTLFSTTEKSFDFLESLDFYSDLYFNIKQKSERLEPGFEKMFYLNNALSKTWSTVFFAAIKYGDDSKTVESKLKIVTNYIDLISGLAFFAGRSNLKNDTNILILSLETIRRFLVNNENSENIEDELINLQYYLYQTIHNRYMHSNVYSENKENPEVNFSSATRANVNYILLRVSNFLELTDGRADLYSTFDKSKYEVEHLLAKDYNVNNFNRNEFIDEQEFLFWRNKIGALGILDKSTNSSLKDASYGEKVAKYTNHNRFLGLLNRQNFRDNGKIANMPKLNKLLEENPDLASYLQPADKMGKYEITQRGKLIGLLAKQVWNPEILIENDMFESTEEALSFCRDFYGDSDDVEYVDFENENLDNTPSKGKEMFMEVDGARFEFIYYGHSNGIILKTIEKCPLVKDVEKLFVELPGLAGVGDAYNGIIADRNTTTENGRFSWTGEMRVPARTPIFFMAGDSADSITYNGEKLMVKTHYKLKH